MAFTYHRKLTFANSDFEEFTNFPVLVIIDDTSGDYPGLEAKNNISFHDSDGTRLSWECAEFNDGGKSYYFVKCLNIAATDTDYIDVYYGGDTTTEDASGVWDSNYKAVYHMKDDTTSTILDSTSNDNDGTKKAANEPVEASGAIGKCQDFDGSDDRINVGDIFTAAQNYLTVETFLTIDDFNEDAFDNCTTGIIGDWTWVPEAHKGFLLTGYYIAGTEQYRIVFDVADGSDIQVVYINITTIGDYENTPLHIVGVYDSVNKDIILYINGSAVSSAGHPGGQFTPNNVASDIYIGYAQLNSERYLDGKVYSVRISNTARSENYIKAQDKILRQQDYVSFGSQQTQVRAPHKQSKLLLIKGRL